jgi:hypothetical protein
MTRVMWKMLHPKATIRHLGFIPDMLHEDDERPAADQLNAAYAFAGGWNPFPGFTLTDNNSLIYKGGEDPPLRPVAEAQLRNEKIYFYESAWVAIVQPDRSYEVCRMD